MLFFLTIILILMGIRASEASLPKLQNRFLSTSNLQLPFAFNYGSRALSIYVFETSPTIRMRRLYLSGANSWNLSRSKFLAADFDGDGLSDIGSVYDWGRGSIGIFLFNSSRNFSPVRVWKSPQGMWDTSKLLFAAVDVGADGKSDVFAVTGLSNRKIRAYVFKRSNGYKPQAVYESANGFSYPEDLFFFSGDIDGDKKDDALLGKYYHNGDFQLYSLTEANRFRLKQSTLRLKLNVKKENSILLSGRVDGDAKDDIFLINERSGRKIQIYVFKSSSNYTPTLMYTSPLKSFYFDKLKFVVGDFDGDGFSDIVTQYNYAPLKSCFYVFTRRNGFKPVKIGTSTYDHQRSYTFSQNSGTGFVVRPFDRITWYVEPRLRLKTGDIRKVVVYNTRKNSGIFLTAFDRKGRKLFSVPCSSGRPGRRSRLGTFTVIRKAKVLRSYNLKLYAPNPIYYGKHTAIHAWPYLSKTRKLYHYEKLGKPASRGCI